MNRDVEDLLRHHAPQVLAALVRRYGHFDAAEDAVQEALLAAARQWPGDGVPDNPRGWLIRVASRRLTDQLRADEARRRREEADAALAPRDAFTAPPPGEGRAPSEDDTLTLLFLCCHPDLPAAAQVALTLRAVGGLTTAEIARAHLVPEATMAQRISRAKQRLKGVPFRPPGPEDRDQRLAAVLHVLYLIFNEGYTATSGRRLRRADLAREAIRLTRAVRRLLPREGAVTGLLALMLLTEARSAARTGPHGELIPLDEQDRTRWDREAIREGTALVEEALAEGPAGAYQLQAAVAALHDEAARPEDTDWPQILALYEVLLRLGPAPDPMAELSRVVALAMVHGPEAGLAELPSVAGRLAGHHRLDAVRAHLLERAGDTEGALAAYRAAAARTLSVPEARYLRMRAARLRGPD
ncbi:sigma-70 family RNA polymerase sigma factor [Streptomyces sp. WAC05374]|uniref:RNA polymerase sigma factor n=1 Tax=Streptomyces sp. WAC05374 TaxID=2487420 RepID=UPI000F87ADF0|nr:sigma-70 family RNA polymerase sigma factor [Streptomyces sp. WAC05374]RST16285.1 sigma-70 family RNA polymerase sigma factor [Streptomyces sp. WAC05374]TDF38796.1 sigma-70 family RNA polymerase sigma factor [Streptomyces sp. WAC05374]TDF45522.1 sigma-70 family RNA polymerase sigma factor [Streptomyces sp. WAC05374]TDF56522.1 sigma-70 family RNA polymerase sigma factor [Streptomyces sp. WAC05374]